MIDLKKWLMKAYRDAPFEAKFAAFYIVLVIVALIVTKNPLAVGLAVAAGLGLLLLVTKLVEK